MDATTIICFAAAVLSLVLAATVLWNDWRSLSHRCFAAGMIVLAAESAAAGLSIQAILPEQILFWQWIRLLALSAIPGCWLAFSFALSGRDFRTLSLRWRATLGLTFLLPVAFAVTFQRHLMIALRLIQGDTGWHVTYGASGTSLGILFLLGCILVLANIERTLRAATGIMRWQIKFMVLGLGLLFSVHIYTASQAIIYSGQFLTMAAINSAALVVTVLLVSISLYRSRVLSVEVYLSHNILHRSLAVMLVGVYLFAVGVITKVTAHFGDVAGLPLQTFVVFLALLLLAIMLMSDRLAQRFKRLVSRHFRRPQHDYRKIWQLFTTKTSDIMDTERFCRAVADLVSDTFQVLSVTLWLVDRPDSKLVFGGSTSLSNQEAQDLLTPETNMGPLLKAMGAIEDPLDVDAPGEPWLDELRRCNPAFFPTKGGHRLCVPLNRSGKCHGLMMVGDRVSGVPYSTEDLDLLGTIAEQTTGHLLNIRMSESLLEAKELEAFQTMSAFFVHDLKNTASTLSLMLQNLPKHYDDPAFREDALSAISKSVGHIKNLIQQLTLLRENLDLHVEEIDLNTVARAALEELPESIEGSIEQDLKSTGLAPMDRARMQTVVTNLLLNAMEATGEQGVVTLRTLTSGNHVVLEVEDEGHGMTHDFIRNSLFRPFRTTKQHGVGIGLFQCKTIVEAHGGRIEVASEEGHGTTFRVFLPREK